MPEITPNYPSVTEVIDDYLVQQPQLLRKRIGNSLRAVAALELDDIEGYPKNVRELIANVAVSNEIYEIEDTRVLVARINAIRAT